MLRVLNISTDLRRGLVEPLAYHPHSRWFLYFALVGAQRTKVKIKNLVLEMEDQAIYRFIYIDISLSIWEVIKWFIDVLEKKPHSLLHRSCQGIDDQAP